MPRERREDAQPGGERERKQPAGRLEAEGPSSDPAGRCDRVQGDPGCGGERWDRQAHPNGTSPAYLLGLVPDRGPHSCFCSGSARPGVRAARL